MLGFLRKIFYLDLNHSEERIKIILFGIKFHIVKLKYQLMRKKSPYYYYKKNNIDITTLPPATGQLRTLQLANLALLKEFDIICKQNNIHYWLDFGTLIGALRHKGFIPWDDDIDLGIFREDYNKIMDIINNNTYNPNIRAYYKNTFIKIVHKKCDKIFLDLFPVDEYGEIISQEEQLKESDRIKKLRRKTKEKIKGNKFKMSDEDNLYFRAQIAKLIRTEILVNKLPQDKTQMMYVWGMDFGHGWKNWFTAYDVYFPFKTIEFEGHVFPCMNKPEEYMTKVYGNYMEYPEKLRLGHNQYKDFSKEEQDAIEDLMKKLHK